MYGFLKFSKIILGNIPRKAGYFLFETAALFLYRFSKKKHILRRNLAYVLKNTAPSASLLKTVYKNYARYYFDLFQKKETILKNIDGSGFASYKPEITSRLNAKQGVIIISMHAGNWDAGGPFLSSYFPGKINVVVEELSPSFFRWFTETRNEWGVNIIRSTDIKKMIKVLNNGELLVLAADRDLEKNGYKMDFFGKKAYIPSGPAKLALMTNSLIIIGSMFRASENHLQYKPVFAEKMLNVDKHAKNEENTLKLTRQMIYEMEKLLKMHPEQWCMLQNIWVAEKNKNTERGSYEKKNLS
ncbi:MAG: lysophospholipid acyltransferase family protein [Candidatus Goldiibacteriota bacterium]